MLGDTILGILSDCKERERMFVGMQEVKGGTTLFQRSSLIKSLPVKLSDTKPSIMLCKGVPPVFVPI